jgi:arylformamidase
MISRVGMAKDIPAETDTAIDWDDAYSNGAYIPGAAAYPGRWEAEAAAFRARTRAELDIAYGPGPREKLDLFLPAGAPRGLFMFVHGGYWLAFGKSDWSHFAAGALARGWAAALPEYPLCPQVRIGDITRCIGRALDVAAARVPGPIVVAGHSAGGHLAARMACAKAPIAAETHHRLRRAGPISGLFDLRPLMHTRMNVSLRIDDAEAAAESPLLLSASGVEVVAWVGADERPEFVRQTKTFAAAWPNTRPELAPGHHHFNVIDGLLDADGAMMRSFLG